MAKKIKLTRKQIKQPDEFLNWTEEAWQWLEKNWMAALGAIAGLILVALLVRLGATWYRMNQGSSSLELSKAEDILFAQVSQGNDPNDNWSSFFNRGPTYKSKTEKYNAAIEAFKKLADGQKGSVEGSLALLHLGALSEKTGDLKAAVEYYGKFLETRVAMDGAQLKHEASLGKARAEYGMKNYNGAIALLDDLLKTETPFKQQAMLLLARSHHRAGNPGQAKEVLDQMNKDFSGSGVTLPSDYLLAYWDSNQPAEPEALPQIGETSSPSPVPGAEAASPVLPFTQEPENPQPPSPDDFASPPAPADPEGQGGATSEPAPAPGQTAP